MLVNLQSFLPQFYCSPSSIIQTTFYLDFATNYVIYIFHIFVEKDKAPLNGLAKLPIMMCLLLGFQITHSRIWLDQDVKQHFTNAPVSP